MSNLSHAGVKGMKWGVRKDRTTKKPAYSVGPDGSIAIDKGFEIQRVFQRDKTASGSSGSNYFAFSESDKHTYVQMMGAGATSKLAFVRWFASNSISTFVASEPIKVPSHKEHLSLMNSSRKKLGLKSIDEGSLEEETIKVTMPKNEEGRKLRASFIKEANQKGYNAVRDLTDSDWLSENPIIILDGEKTLNLVTIRDINEKDLSEAKEFVKKHTKK